MTDKKKPPKYSVGDIVQLGLSHRVGLMPWEVLKVNTAGPVNTYDLVARGGDIEGNRNKAVEEYRIYPHRDYT